MAIIVSQIETPLKANKDEIISVAMRKIGLTKADIVSAEIHKTSLDARKQNNIKFVNSVYFELIHQPSVFAVGGYLFIHLIYELCGEKFFGWTVFQYDISKKICNQ